MFPILYQIYQFFSDRNQWTNIEITIDNENISTSNEIKYLRTHLDKRFIWKSFCQSKKKVDRLKEKLIVLQITLIIPINCYFIK